METSTSTNGAGQFGRQTSAGGSSLEAVLTGGKRRGGLLFNTKWWKNEAFEPLLQKQLLYVWTFACAAVGVGLGLGLRPLQLSSSVLDYISFPGELMLRSLKAIFLPVVAFSLLAGIVGLRRVNDRLSTVIVRYLAFLWLVMVLEVGLAIVAVHFLQLGTAIAPLATTLQGPCVATAPSPPAPLGSAVSSPAEAAEEPLLYFARLLVPTNTIAAAAESQYLGVVSMVSLFGLLVVTLGDPAEQLMQLIEVVNSIITQMMYRIVWFIPIGTASAVAATILRACSVVALFSTAARFCLLVVVVLLLFGLVVAPLGFLVLSNANVFYRLRCFLPALMTAWGSASSTASLAEAVRCAAAGGCAEGLAAAVLGLAGSLNRAGSTLYEATAVLFIAQVHGIPLTPSALLLISLLCTFSPVASMPMGALLSSITALQVFRMDTYLAELAMLVCVDWFLDRFRTVVNVWGDWGTTICIDEWNKAENKGRVLPEEEGEEEEAEGV